MQIGRRGRRSAPRFWWRWSFGTVVFCGPQRAAGGQTDCLPPDISYSNVSVRYKVAPRDGLTPGNADMVSI